MASRREARERAVLLLYEAEMKGVDPVELLGEQLLQPDAYTRSVVTGATVGREALDERIGRLAQGWSLDRMPVIDRTVLRMAIHELANEHDVPTGVILAEAVELAKRYSTEASGRFVNGVLAAAARELRDDRLPAVAEDERLGAVGRGEAGESLGADVADPEAPA